MNERRVLLDLPGVLRKFRWLDTGGRVALRAIRGAGELVATSRRRVTLGDTPALIRQHHIDTEGQ